MPPRTTIYPNYIRLVHVFKLCLFELIILLPKPLPNLFHIVHLSNLKFNIHGPCAVTALKEYVFLVQFVYFNTLFAVVTLD